MKSARINLKNPHGDYLLRPTNDLLDQIRLLLSYLDNNKCSQYETSNT